MSKNSYTLIQSRLLKVLGDGLIHTKKELHSAIGYCRRSGTSTLRVHLNHIRKKLKTIHPDLDLITITDAAETSYRLVRQGKATLKDALKGFQLEEEE